MAKSEFLQIRVTPAEKATLKRLARAAGQELSSYVLTRAIPVARVRFDELLEVLRVVSDHRFALAEVNDLLSDLSGPELIVATDEADVSRLTPFLANYLAALVEQAAHARGIPAPRWTAGVAPLERPYFAAPMVALRPHLLRSAPVPFKKRNLFVDAALGARV
jgi:uncharacterized protein (DUF1778 family)